MRGHAQALLLVLSSRGFAVDAATVEKIERCSDVEQIRSWIVRAATAPSLAAVFGD